MCAGQTGISLRAMAGDRAGQVRFGRFLRNPRVTPAEMVATARSHLLDRVQGRDVVVIQDTTSLRDDGDQRSLHLHPAIAVDAREGALLGLVHAVFLSCTGEEKAPHGRRPFAEKESRRWLDATCEAGKLVAPGRPA